VTLRLRFADFTRVTRSRTLAQATAGTRPLLATAQELLAEAWPLVERQGLTLVGVSVGNLADDDAVQLPLPFERRDPDQKSNCLAPLPKKQCNGLHRYGNNLMEKVLKVR
jgi:DNA polymerase-4